jgi:hypothetical protein
MEAKAFVEQGFKPISKQQEFSPQSDVTALRQRIPTKVTFDSPENRPSPVVSSPPPSRWKLSSNIKSACFYFLLAMLATGLVGALYYYWKFSGPRYCSAGM